MKIGSQFPLMPHKPFVPTMAPRTKSIRKGSDSFDVQLDIHEMQNVHQAAKARCRTPSPLAVRPIGNARGASLAVTT